MIADAGIRAVARWLGIDTDDPERVATVCENEPSLQERIEELPDREVQRLGSAEIAALADAGMAIGFHTLQHPLLSRLSDSALDEALVRGRSELEVAAGRPIRLFAYPHGKADPRAVARAPRCRFHRGLHGSPAAGSSGGRPISPRPVGAGADRSRPVHCQRRGKAERLEQRRISGGARVVEKPLVSVVIPTRNRCQAALHDAPVGSGTARRQSRDRGRRRWFAGRHRRRWSRALATLEFAWCATSRRGARAALAIEGSRRPEAYGSLFSTMTTSGRRTNSAASCRRCWDTRREWAYTGDVVVDGEFRILQRSTTAFSGGS